MNNDANLLVQMLESMTGTKWLILGVLLLVLEVITGTTYILWPAVAALIVGVIAFVLPLAWEMQFLLFFILSGILLVVGHKFVRPKMKGGEPSDLNDRARSMVGMRVKAVADFDTGLGRVQVGDTQWRASITEGNPKSGAELRVVSVKGTTLQVEAV
jgi:membrane protein implicated in regulation of membrane protease activity